MSDTAPKNQNALTWNYQHAPAARQHQPGELLYEFVRDDHQRIRCELRDDGPYGFDVQIFRNEEFSHSFRKPDRALAVAEAEDERTRLELEGRAR